MVRATTTQTRSRLRRHVRWILPLLVGVLAYVTLLPLSSMLSTLVDPNDPADVGTAFAALGVLALALLIPLVASIFVIVGAVRAFGEWRRDRRRATGKFNRAERVAHARHEQGARAWQSSIHLRQALTRHEVPPPVRVWDVVPAADEVFFADTAATYARYYGQDVSYTQSGGFFFGHPLFVAAGLAVTAAGNSARRSAAEASAREQWREHQTVRLVVSNRRLICNVGGQWLSFWYSDMTAVYPEVEQWSLICQFGSTSPLLLTGLEVPSAALITVLMTHGPAAVAEHPSLQALSRDRR